MPVLRKATTIDYPEGTRSAAVRIDANTDIAFDLDAINLGITKAVHEFNLEHGLSHKPADLFITIAFRRGEALIEISDRLVRLV